MSQNYIQLIQKKYKAIILITVSVISVVIFLTSLMPFKYESTAQLMIIQNEVEGDLYTASKAAERLGTSLSRVIYTTSFYERVLDTKYIDESYFASDPGTQRKEWNNSIETEVVPQTAIIKVTAYNFDKQKATNIVTGIASVLSENSEDFYGKDNNITISIVNEPLTSNYPTKPNVFINLFVGLVIGFLISAMYVIFIPIKETYEKKQAGVVKDKKVVEENIDEQQADIFMEKYSVLDVTTYLKNSGLTLEPVEIRKEYTLQDNFAS